ncbi:MAG: cyclodeaminase/cyclohydrolase family protein [Mogibacterium sp.]|nr:cyclodeaminase/cyclohydrolase family protein [Mogibacterium sp.]
MSRSFKDINIEDYLKRLGSGDPTPGGGAAAALTSAQGAALIMMVANHTIGKPKYAEFEELNKDILSEAEVLLGSLTDGIDNDAIAFGKVSAAYALPKTDEEKRSAEIASASVLAAEAPLMVMEDSLSALRLAATLKGRSNKMLESDVFVAALHLYAGIRSAYYNVEANMPAIAKADPELAMEMRQHTADVLSEAAEIFAELSGKK